MKQFLRDIARILTATERKRFRWLIVLDILLSVVDICFLIMLVIVAGFYTGTIQTITLPTVIQNMLQQYPLLLIGIFTVLYAIKNGLGFILFRRQFSFVYDVASRISAHNLSAYLAGSFAEYVNVDSSVRIRKISQQPVEFSHYVLRGIQQITGNLVLILCTLVPIILYKPVLFLLLMGVLLPPAIVTAFITKKKLAALRIHGKTNREKTIQHLQEALTGYVESNIYHRKNFFLRRYKHYQDQFNSGLAEHQVMQQLPGRLIEVFAVLGLFILVAFNYYAGTASSVPVILIGGFIAAAYKIIPGIVRILNSMEQVRTYAFTVKDLVTELKQITPEAEQHHLPLETIAFEKTGFSYENEKVLQDFSMQIKKGEFVGLSGLSGKGKTTVINILLGFLQPESGNVLVNGKRTVARERQSCWSRISYIKQQSFFIHDSLRNNITLEEGFEIEKLKRVLQVTGTDRIADEHPQGIDTVLAENGKNISGGQRQRIAIARALYKEADLIILDEPFNELDRVSEDRLLDHFRSLAHAGKMVLLITHNRESLSFCNKIITLGENA